MELRDAHCHYQFAEVPYAAVEQARTDGVGPAMINGSSPADWEDVAALGRRDPRNRAGNVLDVFLAPGVTVDFARLTRHVFAASSCALCWPSSPLRRVQPKAQAAP